MRDVRPNAFSKGERCGQPQSRHRSSPGVAVLHFACDESIRRPHLEAFHQSYAPVVDALGVAALCILAGPSAAQTLY